MLLLGFDFFYLRSYKVFLANSLTAATLLLAKHWKSQEMPNSGESISKRCTVAPKKKNENKKIFPMGKMFFFSI